MRSRASRLAIAALRALAVAGLAAAAATIAGASLGGCLDRGVFRCGADRACGPGGFCEATGYCSFPDPGGCPSGRRYGRHAGDDVANTCVANACPASPLMRVWAGGAHACAVRNNGGVWCWGAGSDGQLGDGAALTRATMKEISGLDAAEIAAGDRHTCAALRDGTVTCWGANDDGQLGDGTRAARALPAPVPDLAGVTRIAAGTAFTCAIRQAAGGGEVVCWGRNRDGQVGGGTPDASAPAPTAVALPAAAVRLVARDRHACALCADGGLWCWGANSQGELGDGTVDGPKPPTRVAMPADVPIGDLAAGAAHTCALGGGQIWCWGANQLGELGDGSGQNHASPTLVSSLSAVAGLAAAGHHSCARTSDGSVWCWGANQAGQLGEGTTSSIDVPVPVTGLPDAADIAAGDSFACALRHDGTLWCWGDARQGQLGTGAATARARPVRALAIDTALSITAGGEHSCARRPASDGASTTVCWGDNQAGQIGDGTRIDRAAPVALKITLNAFDVSAGGQHTCLEGGDRSVWCWGRGGSGQLGTTALIDAIVPSHLPDFDGVDGIASGGAHTCAPRGGAAWCWGANDQGQLGDGSTTGRSLPMPAGGTADVVELALGGEHTCARHRDGGVTCWGRGVEGQLGDGLMTSSPSPVAVVDPASGSGAALAGVVGLAAGARHTCAVLADGTAACWGDGDNGQLGWGVPRGHGVPTAVMSLDDVAAIAAGAHHTCALTAGAQQIHCWGGNDDGQLGDGTALGETMLAPAVDRPVLASEIDDGPLAAIAIAAGASHTCAVRKDRRVMCWGSDMAGQLGEGTILQYSTPQPARVICP